MKGFAVITLATWLASSTIAAADGLRYVRQSVFGMDCAPCAYGVEKGLRALPGVQEVTVSLNEGYAEADLAADSSTTLTQIREAIRKNGFTPKQATLRIEGEFSPAPIPTLRTGEEEYQLEFDRSAATPTENARVAITGTVAADGEARIMIERIDRLAPAD